MPNQSGFTKQKSRINQILSVIQRHGQIHKFDLMESAQIPISEYNKLKPLVEYYGEKIDIEIRGQFWISNKEPELIRKDNLESEIDEVKKMTGGKSFE